MGRLKIALTAAMAALSLAACSPKASSGANSADDMSLGSPTAKVTVVEYASVGCPVCGRWAREVWPAFKTKYVDTNRVHFVYREMLVGGGSEVAVAASGFLVARCVGKERYFSVLDAIYSHQDEAFQNPRETLLNVAKSTGMTEAQFNTCINDEPSILALNKRVEKHVKEDKVDSTPTFVINGQTMTPGFRDLSELDAAIAAAGG